MTNGRHRGRKRRVRWSSRAPRSRKGDSWKLDAIWRWRIIQDIIADEDVTFAGRINLYAGWVLNRLLLLLLIKPVVTQILSGLRIEAFGGSLTINSPTPGDVAIVVVALGSFVAFWLLCAASYTEYRDRR